MRRAAPTTSRAATSSRNRLKGSGSGFSSSPGSGPTTRGVPVKFRVFAHHLPMTVYSAGVYTIGIFSDPDAGEAEFAFPLPVLRLNPLTGVPN